MGNSLNFLLKSLLMCINQARNSKIIYWSHLYVSVVNVPLVFKEKAAHRVSRIKFQDSPNLTTLIVTLTYRRS